MIAVYKKELKSYFHSFIGPLFIGVTLFLVGLYFAAYNLFMGYPYIGYGLSAVIFLFFISVPILTMRIFAEERKQKTDQFLLTSPIGVFEIVLGKFFALATLLLIPMALICTYPLILSRFGTISFAESYLAIGAFFLYGLACIAIGEFVSSTTESQVIAAAITFGILFWGYVITGICNMISSTGNIITKILSVFDMVGRFDDLMSGSLELKSCVYFISIIVLFLLFTEQSIQKRRYRVSKKNLSLGAYNTGVIVGSIAIAVVLNVIVAQLPGRYTSFDLTANKLYSLTSETKDLIKDISEDVNIYVLVKESQADSNLAHTLQSYEGLNSHIKVSYVDPAVNPKFYTQYTNDSISTNSVIVESGKRSRVINYGNIYESQMDYSNYSSTVTGYDGEGQITSAISYVLSENMPKLYAITGHGEREMDATFQAVIEKANIETETINLMNCDAVPEDASGVIINAPTSDYSKDDADKVLNYLKQGGKAFINTAYTGTEQENFSRILDFYGVQLTTGLIIEQQQNGFYQDPFYLLPQIEENEITQGAASANSYIFAPYSQGLQVEEREDVSVTPLLSSSAKSYIRQEIKQNDTYEKQDGDIDGPFYIGVSCITQTGENSSTGFIFSCENLFTKDADDIVAGTNQQLFAGVLQEFQNEEETHIVIPIKPYQVDYLIIPQIWISVIALVTVLILPFGFLISGFVVWFKRRKH